MRNIEIVIDESVDYTVIKKLRANGFAVYSICEEQSSLSDKKVLEIAAMNSALLITEDKDFGELVYRLKLRHTGILLVRMIEADSEEKSEAVLKTILKYYDDLLNNFSVLDNKKIRVRK